MSYKTTGLTKQFNTSISIDNGFVNNYQGEFDQTFELFKEDDTHFMIEWDIPNMETTEHIGLTFDKDGNLIDYDGVFSVPDEAIEWIESLGLGLNMEYAR